MKSGVLVVGHGSRLEYNRNLVAHMASVLEERGEFGPVEAAFMQLNKPDIRTGIKRLAKRGVDVIYVQPCFLASGIHLTKDVPGELGLDEGKTEGEFNIGDKKVILKYCGPIGADDRVADILADRIRERAKKG